MAFPASSDKLPVYRIQYVRTRDPKIFASVKQWRRDGSGTVGGSTAVVKPIDGDYYQEWHLTYAERVVDDSDERACILTEATGGMEGGFTLGLKSIETNRFVFKLRHAQCWILKGNNHDGYAIYQKSGDDTFNWRYDITDESVGIERSPTVPHKWRFVPVEE